MIPSNRNKQVKSHLINVYIFNKTIVKTFFLFDIQIFFFFSIIFVFSKINKKKLKERM